MNKSYISVWNDATGTWVAAPETAKAHGGAGTVSSCVTSSDNRETGRSTTPLKVAFMPIAMAIGVAMLPGTAFAQATPGVGGLELCPGNDGMGGSYGMSGSNPGSMTCDGESHTGMSFSLNNAADASGAFGYASGAISARVTGYGDGLLELMGNNGISMLNTVNMNDHKITGLAMRRSVHDEYRCRQRHSVVSTDAIFHGEFPVGRRVDRRACNGHQFGCLRAVRNGDRQQRQCVRCEHQCAGFRFGRAGRGLRGYAC